MAMKEQIEKFKEQIKEQEWFQQLESSFEQLSPEQQTSVKWGAVGAVAFALVYFTFTTIDSASTAKSEYYEKQELAQTISKAGDEIRRLKGQNAGFSQNNFQNWKSTIAGIASIQSISGDKVEVTKESPGATQSVIQETLLEIDLKSVDVRALVPFIFQLEHSSPPMKLKGMSIHAASEGTLNAILNVSGYLAKPEKGEKSK